MLLPHRPSVKEHFEKMLTGHHELLTMLQSILDISFEVFAAAGASAFLLS